MPESYTLDLIGRMLQTLMDRVETVEATQRLQSARLAAIEVRLQAIESLTSEALQQLGGLESRLLKRIDRLEHAHGLEASD